MISRNIQFSVWLALFVFWCWVSIDHHPTFAVDVVVTAILLATYIVAVYLNHLVLVPKFWNHHAAVYWLALMCAMGALTLIALISLRFVYSMMMENGASLLGDFWSHYAIDFSGMIIHVAGAAIVVAVAKRNTRH